MKPECYMELAIKEARRGANAGEIPIGALAISNGDIIASSHNSPISDLDPTSHAEINVIREAARSLGAYRTPGLEIYVTLEPCLMCFGAMLHARVSKLYYGASDPKIGFSKAYSLVKDEGFFNHIIEISSGIMAAQCAEVLKDFFRSRRQK